MKLLLGIIRNILGRRQRSEEAEGVAGSEVDFAGLCGSVRAGGESDARGGRGGCGGSRANAGAELGMGCLDSIALGVGLLDLVGWGGGADGVGRAGVGA